MEQSRKAHDTANSGFLTLPRRTGRPLVMGIVNVTPDSFSDGGRFLETEAAIAHGIALARAGADILDIGGESTRPGSDPVPVAAELERVLPVISALRQETKLPISIDTMKPQVAEAAVLAGAGIWNDVTALTFMPQSAEVAAQLRVPVILMHMLGQPKTMQRAPTYMNVVAQVTEYLAARVRAAREAGIPADRIAVDPGIGFGKTLEHNLELLNHLGDIQTQTGCPLLLGASRKRFISALDVDADEDHRLGGSLAAAAMGAEQDVWCIRVHDVRETRQFLDIRAAINKAAR